MVNDIENASYEMMRDRIVKKKNFFKTKRQDSSKGLESQVDELSLVYNFGDDSERDTGTHFAAR